MPKHPPSGPDANAPGKDRIAARSPAPGLRISQRDLEDSPRTHLGDPSGSLSDTLDAPEKRRSARWCRAGSRLARHLAQFVPGYAEAKGRGLDRVPTLIETHSWSTPNGFQASQDDPSIGLLRDAECLPGTNTAEHNPTFRIDYPNGHGGNVPTRRGICQPATSTARGARRCGRRRH